MYDYIKNNNNNSQFVTMKLYWFNILVFIAIFLILIVCYSSCSLLGLVEKETEELISIGFFT